MLTLQTLIDHFTVVRLQNGSEAGVDVVLIQTSLFLLCKSIWSYANWFEFTREKQRGGQLQPRLHHVHGQVTKHTTVKWPIG